MFVVTVDFQIHPEHFDAFMVGMLANAKASVELEENCVQFDVCVSNADPHHVFLYELYQNQDDFEKHLKMPHFLEFNAQSAPLVKSKSVHLFNRSEN